MKGIDGWVAVAKKIKSIFSKSDLALMDLETSKVYGLLYLSKQYKLQSIEVEKEVTIELENLSGMLPDRKHTDFIAKPWSIYIITYIINEKDKIILSIRSDGEIKEITNINMKGYIPF